MNDPLQKFAHAFIPAVEKEMTDVLKLSQKPDDPFWGMMHYHMGWVNEAFEPIQSNAGKRVRPLLCLLVAESAGGDWRQAVPGAASLELLHNFTLIHDDIQDASPTRRGRPALWQIWGPNLAINCGDAMFAASHVAMFRMVDLGVPAKTVVQSGRRLDETCIELTEGQYADMTFEQRDWVPVHEYLAMIEDKTAALLSFSAELGARIAKATPTKIDHYAAFGRDLGLAFQVRDDILGIWGDESIIGKSAATDITARKKSLPILYGLSVSDELRTLYQQMDTDDKFVNQVVGLLDEVGAGDYAVELEEQYASGALKHLEAAQPDGDAGKALHQLTLDLLNRQA